MEEEKSPMVGMSEEEKEQYVSEQALAIIMSAGDARTIAKEAFDEIVAGNFEHAEELMHQADRKQVEAHNVQTMMIQGDIRGGDEKMGYYVLFAHAQDTLMTIQTELNMTRSMLKLARAYDARSRALEAKLA